MSINAEHKGRLVAPMTGAGKHSLCATCYAQSNLDSLMGSPTRSLFWERGRKSLSTLCSLVTP